jgi:hypothetical protein
MLRRLQTRAWGGVRAGQGRPLALLVALVLALLLARGGDGALPDCVSRCSMHTRCSCRASGFPVLSISSILMKRR